jgi:hypothetical protein
LRISLTLKEDMITICDRYQINESDFMRRAISESIKKHLKIESSPDNRYMFL